MSLTLTVKDSHDITLPDWIGETTLTLAEIGAVACMSCMASNAESAGQRVRMASEEMAVALMSLQKKGVLVATMEGTRVSLVLDLDRALATDDAAQP